MQAIQKSRQFAEILDLLCTEPGGHGSSKAQLPTFFKICLVIAIFGATSAMMIAILANFGWMPQAGAAVWSFRLLGIGELSALTMSFSIAWSFPKEMKKPLARVRSSALQLDHQKISQLRSFPSQDL